MKRMMIFFAVIVMIWSNALIAEPTENQHQIGGKHLDSGLVCVDCHATETPTKRPPVSACTECHGPYADIAELTKEVKPNPHNSHQGEIRCGMCHRSHEPSVNYCNECHEFDFKVK